VTPGEADGPTELDGAGDGLWDIEGDGPAEPPGVGDAAGAFGSNVGPKVHEAPPVGVQAATVAATMPPPATAAPRRKRRRVRLGSMSRGGVGGGAAAGSDASLGGAEEDDADEVGGTSIAMSGMLLDADWMPVVTDGTHVGAGRHASGGRSSDPSGDPT
jgi:hypothetical protein